MITVKCLPPFKILYNLPKGTNVIVAIGGRGGSKTYEVSKFAAFSSTIRNKRTVVLRDERETIRESILNEIFLRYDTANTYGHFDGIYDKTESGIRDLESGEMLVFTKGFRASSTQKTANLKSISDVDIAIVEEAEDIRDKTKFDTFADSIRKEDSLIIIVLNTPDINHWVIKRFFNLDPVLNAKGEATGYFKLVPKKIPGFVCIQTSYKDNPHLPDHVVRKYESYGDPESPFYDLHYYYTAILGYASSGRQGQVITHAKPIKLADYLALPYTEYYGQDFGTASPAGLIGVKMHRDIVWARELNYKPMDELGLAKLYCSLKFTQKEKIIADSANRLAINKLRSGWKASELKPEDLERYPQLTKGFFVLGAIKGPGSIEDGISMLKSKELYIVEESFNFWEEIRNYVYAKDKNGNLLDEPEDDFNHLIDPLRGVVTGKGKIFH